MAHLLVFVLDNLEQCSDILNAWEEAGTPGVTILESTGLARLRRAKHDRFLFVAPRGTESRGTLVARVDDEGLNFFALDFLRVETR